MKFLKSISDTMIVELPKFFRDLERIEKSAKNIIIPAKKNGICEIPPEVDHEREDIIGNTIESMRRRGSGSG